jgi:hypothetical protein
MSRWSAAALGAWLVASPGVLQMAGTAIEVRAVPHDSRYAVIWTRGRVSYGLYDSLPAARQRAEQVERDLRTMGEVP